ncbi:MAG TPA: Spy/CpxP family protein refolding chaperone [Burkholderiaceae bacterium]|nr:Spy/CpxP family protein refolding chaperone [Burkholderiaceae bacterium]
MNIRHALSASCLMLASAVASAPHDHRPAPTSPYAGEESRAIKALSAERVEQLLAGEGLGYAKAAELNGHPGPAHVLQWAQALRLSPAQRQATERLMQRHKERARELGRELVEAERRLDQALRHAGPEPASIARLVEAAGRVEAALRAEHLATHLAQTAILTREQISHYHRLRGYAPRGQDPKEKGHSHVE